jgi:3-phosphoshikimate 1-carboxyvinyltransferase
MSALCKKAALVKPSFFGGEITIPPSKSQTMRAIVFAMLSFGKSTIWNYLLSPDIEAMIQAGRLLGATIDVFPDRLEVVGDLKTATDVINAANSGLILRFIGAISGLTAGYTVITGDSSIRHIRPVKPLLDGLQQLGCFAISSCGNNHPPIIIQGPLKGGVATIDGEDSQPVSALLIASAFAKAKTEIYVKNPQELPWVEVTLSWFDRLKIPYENIDFKHYFLQGFCSIPFFDYFVPADWSSASYPIVAALITNSTVTVRGVDFQDKQGDKEFITLLKRMGAKMEVGNKYVKVLSGGELNGCRIDINRFIDALPLAAVVGCFATGKTEVFGGGIARKKESDRISSIVRELKKMGAKIVEKEDGFVVEQSTLHGSIVDGHSDHRIVMSLIVAAFGARGESIVLGIDSIQKSFFNFFEKFYDLGANIELIEK